MPLPRSLAPLRHRSYAALWAGAFVSNIGTWMESIAVGVYVTQVTGRSGWTGAVAAAAFVPNALFGPIGGALADRLPRRALLLTTNGLQTLLALALMVLIAAQTRNPALVAALVFAAGCVGSAGFPAYQALLPDLVPDDDLPGAVALSATQWNLGRVIGPAVAGVVISTLGAAWALGVNAASFLAPMFVIALIRIPRPVAPPTGSLFASIKEGIGYARREPGLRVALRCMALTAFLAAPFIALVPAMGELVLDAGTTGTAALVTAQGAGAVTAGLLLGTATNRYGSRRVLLAVWAMLPVALTLYALAPTIWFAVPAIFLLGGVYLGALASTTTVVQVRAPARLRGRVLSVFMVMLGAFYPLGSALQGWLGDLVGLRATTVLAAAGFALVMGGARVLRPRFADPLDHPSAPTPAAPAPPSPAPQ